MFISAGKYVVYIFGVIYLELHYSSFTVPNNPREGHQIPFTKKCSSKIV